MKQSTDAFPVSRDFDISVSGVGHHWLTSPVIETSWATSKTYSLLLELRFYLFVLSSYIHLRFGRPPRLFPVSVDNDRYTIVMGYAVAFDGGSDNMKNKCVFAGVLVITTVQFEFYATSVLGRHIGAV